MVSGICEMFRKAWTKNKMQKELLLIVALCRIFHLPGIESMDVYLSKRKGSVNSKKCGYFIKPCKTLDYVIRKKKLYCGDTLLFDSGPDPDQPYHYLIKNSYQITCFVTLKKSNHSKTTALPVLKYTANRHISNDNYLFYVTAQTMVIDSLVFEDVSFNNDDVVGPDWFYCNSMTTLKISNSRFKSNRIFKPYGFRVLPEDIRSFTTIQAEKINHLELLVTNHTVLLSNASIAFVNISFFGGPYQNVLIPKFSIRNSFLENIELSVLAKIHLELINSTFSNSIFNNQEDWKRPTVIKVTQIPEVDIKRSTFINVPVSCEYVDNLRVENSVFQDISLGTHYTALAVSYTRYSLTLRNCMFSNNTSKFGLSSSLSVNSIRWVTLTMENITVIASKRPSLVLLLNSLPELKSFQNVSIFCTGSNTMYMGNYKDRVSYILLGCQKCSKGFYNLYPQSIRIRKITYLHEFNSIEKVGENCTKCPYGGICLDGFIRSKGSYWGFHHAPRTIDIFSHNHTNSIKYLPCPTYHCCSTEEECLNYNTCARNRIGRLCSECKTGLSTSISGNYQCVKNTTCYHWFTTALIYFLISVLFLFTLLYLKEMLLLFKRIFHSISKKCKNNETNVNDESSNGHDLNGVALTERILPVCYEPGENNHNHVIPYQLLLTANVDTLSYPKQGSFVSGSIKILFFFYQASAIIRIQSVDKLKYSFPKVLNVLTSFFNIRLDFSYSSVSLCILRNMNSLAVELMKLGYVLIILCTIAILYIICQISSLCSRHHQRRSEDAQQVSSIDEDIPTYSYFPFKVRLQCVYLQFLLIAYVGIALFSFNSVNCVEINNERFLYIQASIQCYQSWQYVMLVFIALWVVPFFIVLQFASKQLSHCSLLPSEFLLIITFPPSYLWYLLKCKLPFVKPIQMKKEELMLAKHLLKVIYEPFRDSIVCWESVLIFRRTLLVVFRTFIFRPINRLYPSAALLLVSIVHHTIARPFSEEILNMCELVSLALLLSLVFVNMFWAVTTEYALLKSSTYHYMGSLLLVYETIVMILPFITLVLFAFCNVGMKIVKFLKRRFNKALYDFF